MKKFVSWLRDVQFYSNTWDKKLGLVNESLSNGPILQYSRGLDVRSAGLITSLGNSIVEFKLPLSLPDTRVIAMFIYGDFSKTKPTEELIEMLNPVNQGVNNTKEIIFKIKQCRELLKTPEELVA